MFNGFDFPGSCAFVIVVFVVSCGFILYILSIHVSYFFTREISSMNEAAARIKINKLLEAAGWRFFDEDGKPANIRVEQKVVLKREDLDGLGDDFENATGRIDFLLLNEKGFPLVILEAKSEEKNPLAGKEQARKYARSQNCRFVILSNGNLHYFWDLERGNPYLITSFPTPESVTNYSKVQPNPQRLVDELWARTTSYSRSGRIMLRKPRGKTKPSAPASSNPTN